MGSKDSNDIKNEQLCIHEVLVPGGRLL